MIEEFVRGEIEDFLDLIKDRDQVFSLFQQLDTDKSGVLERKEIKPLIKDIFSKRNFKSDKKRKEKIIKTLDMVIERYDVNKDGNISFDEFEKMMIFIMANSIKEGVPKIGLSVQKAIEAFENESVNIVDPKDKASVKELIECMKLK